MIKEINGYKVTFISGEFAQKQVKLCLNYFFQQNKLQELNQFDGDLCKGKHRGTSGKRLQSSGSDKRM